MLNPTNIDNSVSSRENSRKWNPREKHQIVPTLVLACGALSSREYKSLKDRILERVNLKLPQGFVHWSAREQKDEALLEKVEQVLMPFLKLDYVERLQARGLVQHLLDDEREYDLHIIVVHKREKGTNPSQFLRDLGARIRETMAGGVRFSLILVAIGEGTLDLGENSPFWPCFRVGPVSYGRFLVSDERILEVCQNLLVSLITSELLRAIEYEVGEEKQSIAWIWLGASALVVDVASMQNYVRLKVLHHLVDGMLAVDPTRAELQRTVEQETERGIAKLQGENLARALGLLSDYWTIHAREHEEEHYPTNQIIEEPTLARKKDIYQKIVKPDLDLARALKKHYLSLRDRLIKNLSLGIRERYEKIVGEIFELFEPPQDVAGTETAPEWQLECPPLYGLATVTHAVETAAENLRKSADVVYPRLRRHEIGSDEYLASVADEDAQFAHRNFIQYRRKERIFLSWVGFLIKLLPAWPILTGVLVALPSWGLLRWTRLVFPSWPGEWCAAIVAFLALTVIATIEYISWQIELSQLWNWLRHRALKEIGETVLQITYKVLRDYRMLMVGRLQEIGTVLRELIRLLEKVEGEYQVLAVEIENRVTLQQKRQAAIYWLSDLTTCNNWAKQALKAIDVVQMTEDQKKDPLFSAQTRTMLERILHGGPRFSYGQGTNKVLSHREIYDQIETVAQQAINIVSQETRLEYYQDEEIEEHRTEIERAPVGGLGVQVLSDMMELPPKRISKENALKRMVLGKLVYLDDERREKATGREPLSFINFNELDICVLIEREELLKKGKCWQWLFKRAIPLGNGAKVRSLAFLTAAHDSVWRVSAFGQYSLHWRWKREGEKEEDEVGKPKEEIKIARSALANEIGCVRAIVEYKEAVN